MAAIFSEFPKMARLSRECIITEKIDGTNSQILIEDVLDGPSDGAVFRSGQIAIWAGSRNRWLDTTSKGDNFGFAKWVAEHGEELKQLGCGRHFGEWWGKGIQRGYGIEEKRFSLFNTTRFCLHGEVPEQISPGDPRANALPKFQMVLPQCVGLVPVLYQGEFTTSAVEKAIQWLRCGGSAAAPGFMNPEGVVVFHVAAGVGFKKTLENDEIPKSLR